MRCTVATRHSVSVGATGGGRGESTVILASCCLGIGGGLRGCGSHCRRAGVAGLGFLGHISVRLVFTSQ